MVAVLPLWSLLVVQACLLFLLLAYSTLGRYALYVIFVTPFVIFLGDVPRPTPPRWASSA